VPEDPITKETMRKEHGADQDVKNGKERDENAYASSEEKTCYQDWEVIEVEDEGNLFNEVGSNKGHNEDEGDQDFFKMGHHELLDTFHILSPGLLLLQNKQVEI
jgi:hypothetical protein